MKGIVACLFEQPSLRTAASFSAAAVSLGYCPVFINTSLGSEFRSQVDRTDEINQLTLMHPRFVVLRTGSELDPNSWENSKIPIISGGDGPNEHPTQALIDIYTMRQFGPLEGKRILLMGNARDHRTLHSLALGLEKFDVKVQLVAPEGTDLPPRYFTENMTAVTCRDKSERESFLREADFVYISPIKFNNNPQLLDHQGVASLNLSEAIKFLKPTAKVLHPFPRFGELAHDLDHSRYDSYHLQAQLATSLRIRLFRFLEKSAFPALAFVLLLAHF